MNITKRNKLTDIENRLMITSREGGSGDISVRKWYVQTVWYKIGCKDIPHNMRNITNIL